MTSHQWEFSKENVLPARKGRSVAALNATLASENTNSFDREAMLNEQRHEYERAIQDEESDDPLQLWEKYIQWIIDSYPANQENSKLTETLFKCCVEFKDDPRYKSSIPYLRVWLQFCERCPEPDSIFKYLYSNGICTSHALLYEKWSQALEDSGKYKLADKVLQEGMKKMAMPVSRLQKRLQEFQIRLGDKIRRDMDKSDIAPAHPAQMPMHLNPGLSMRAVTNENAAGSPPPRPTARSVHGLGIIPPLPQQASVARAPTSNIGFQIYDDGGVSQGEQLEAKMTNVPVVTKQRTKENNPIPSAWSDQRIEQSFTPVVSQAKFQIFQDDEPVKTHPQVQQQPVKKALDGVLGAKVIKEDVRVNPMSNLDKAKPSVSERTIFDPASLMSDNNEELSFEEVRALHFLAKEVQAQEEERAQQQAEEARQRQLKQQQALKQQQQQQQQQQQENRSNFTAVGERSVLNFEGTTHTTSNMMEIVKHLNFSTPMENPPRKTVFQQPAAHGIVRSSSNIVTSPTINTKSALADVMAMFKQPLKEEDHAEEDYQDQTDDSIRFVPVPEPKPSASSVSSTMPAFEIFEDPTMSMNLNLNMNKAASALSGAQSNRIAVYEDEDENNVFENEENQENIPVKPFSKPPALPHTLLSNRPAFNVLPMPAEEFHLVHDDELENDDFTPMAACTNYTPAQLNFVIHEDAPSVTANKFVIFEEEQEEQEAEQQPPLRFQTQLTTPKFVVFEDGDVDFSFAQSTPFSSTNVPVAKTASYKPSSEILEPIMETSNETERTSSSSNQSSEESVHNETAPPENEPSLNFSSIPAAFPVRPIDDDSIVVDLDMNRRFLQTLSPPLSSYEGFELNRTLPCPSLAMLDQIIQLGGGNEIRVGRVLRDGASTTYAVERCGGFHKWSTSDMMSAVKSDKLACAWEFYILHRLHHNLDMLHNGPAAHHWFVRPQGLYKFAGETGALLFLDYHEQPTLRETINVYTHTNRTMEEHLVMYYAIELLQLLDTLHQCNLVHGNISPENLLLRNDFTAEGTQAVLGRSYCADGSDGWCTRGVRLINFEQALDLTVTASQANAGKRADAMGALKVIHQMLFQNELRIEHEGSSFRSAEPLKRYWNLELWSAFYHRLLNEPITSSLLNDLQAGFISAIQSNPLYSKTLKNLLNSQDILLFEQSRLVSK